MNIKRWINQNRKLIWNTFIVIVFAFLIIKSLNFYYEEQEERKKIEINEKIANNEKNKEQKLNENDYKTESDSIETTMASFVNYCNNREIENAYRMLTDECKEAMFPTVDYFKNIYIKNVYNVQKQYKLTKWSTDGNISTYLVELYEDMLATGNINSSIEEYYTFVEDDNGNYKLNINKYIYGEDRNIQNRVDNITVKIGHVDVYEEYESAEITITNNSSKTICLTGNKYKKNIYLQNSKDLTYSSLNSKFDNEEIIMTPNSVKSFIVRFNKTYDAKRKATHMVLSDVILDYEEYLSSTNKNEYSNRTSIKIQYQK